MEVKGLAPCPFCVSEVELWDTSFGMVKVFECKNCKTRFLFPWDKDVSEWNRRAGEEVKGQGAGKAG